MIYSDTAIFNYAFNTTNCGDGTLCPYPNNSACCSQKRGITEIVFENSGITHNHSAAATQSIVPPTSTAPTPSASPKSISTGGLSTGAGAGIGAGVAIGVCVLAGLLFLVGRQMLKRRRPTDQAQASTSADESKESPLSHTPNAGLLPQEMGDEGQRPMSHEMALTTPSPGHKPDRVSVFSEA